MRPHPQIPQFFIFFNLISILTSLILITPPTSASIFGVTSLRTKSESLTITLNTTKQYYYLGEYASIHGNVSANELPVTNSLVAIEIDTVNGPLLFRTTNTGENPSETPSATITQFFPCDDAGNPKSTFYNNTLAYFNFRIKNNLQEPIPTLSTITVFDNASRPRGLTLLQMDVSPGESDPNRLAIPIPGEMPTCNATACLSVYSHFPRENGIAYCPETIASFQVIGTAPGGGQNITIIPSPPGSYNYTFKLPFWPGGNYATYVTTWQGIERAYAHKTLIAATWYVDDDKPADFNAIQAAINAAGNWQTIFVYNGKYKENVVVNKTLTIIGENSDMTIIDGGMSGTVVSISSDRVTLTGFQIENSSTSTGRDYGVYIVSSYNTITNNLLINNVKSLWLNSSSNTISENIISDSIGTGLTLQSSSENTVSSNTIRFSHQYSMELLTSSDNTFSKNRIEQGSRAIRLDHSQYNVFSENVIVGNTLGGIRSEYSSHNLFASNSIVNGSYGIWLGYSDNNTITQNIISKNVLWGIVLYSSQNNTISVDNLTDNGVGVSSSSSYGNKVYNCNFINSNQVFSESSQNMYDDGYPSGGNYWSDYSGPDKYNGLNQDILGSDGMIDAPREFDPDNIDHYPLLKYYGKPDIAITNLTLSKTLVGLGFCMRISAYVINYNIDPAASFIYFLGNGTILGTRYVALAGRSYTLAIFSWNTTGATLGNYTISAYATPVPGESGAYTLDNYFTNGNVVVWPLLGDLDVNGKVGPGDFFAFSKAYGSTPQSGDAWNPNCDFDESQPYKVGPRDFYYFGKNYGKSI